MSQRTAWGAAILVLALAAPAQADGDAARGERTFLQCSVCHSVVPGVTKLGPLLAGVVGRKAASEPGFDKYSEALKNSRLTWTPAELDRFLADPQAAVPGTKQPVKLANAQERADIIAYLATVPKP